MTLLNVSDKTVAALDRVRLQRGIRTRAKALEVELAEALSDSAQESARELAARGLQVINPDARGYSDALIMEIATQAVKEDRAKQRRRG